jgi:hypothetical protein
MRARRARRCGVVGLRTHRSNCDRTEASSGTAAVNCETGTRHCCETRGAASTIRRRADFSQRRIADGRSGTTTARDPIREARGKQASFLIGLPAPGRPRPDRPCSRRGRLQNCRVKPPRGDGNLLTRPREFAARIGVRLRLSGQAGGERRRPCRPRGPARTPIHGALHDDLRRRRAQAFDESPEPLVGGRREV